MLNEEHVRRRKEEIELYPNALSSLWFETLEFW
jgi:hypothetical protein